MTPEPVRPPRIVDREVEQRRSVQRPGRTVEGVPDLIRKRLVGVEVLDPQDEAFISDMVSRVRQAATIRGDSEGAEAEELRVASERVLIEQHLLARERFAAFRGRWRVVTGDVRDAALDAVLLSLHGARVVPPG